jgi:hypothetical protein
MVGGSELIGLKPIGASAAIATSRRLAHAASWIAFEFTMPNVFRRL